VVAALGGPGWRLALFLGLRCPPVKPFRVFTSDPALVVELDDALGVAELLGGKPVAAGHAHIQRLPDRAVSVGCTIFGWVYTSCFPRKASAGTMAWEAAHGFP
jgi:hypothetical protein